MKSLSNETLNFFLQKVLGFLHFGSCQNCMSSYVAIATLKDLRKMAVLKEHLNKTDMEKVG